MVQAGAEQMSRISQQQLESYLWGAATLLRGTIDAGDYKQFIFPRAVLQAPLRRVRRGDQDRSGRVSR